MKIEQGVPALVETIAPFENYEGFQITGIEFLIDQARRKSSSGKPLVAVVAGSPGAGKTFCAQTMHDVLPSALLNSDMPLPQAYHHPQRLPSPVEPPFKELISQGIVGTDFFLHPRKSQYRTSLRLEDWWREQHFALFIKALSSAILQNQSDVPLINIYERESGNLIHTEQPISFPIGPLVIIEGIFAFHSVPILETYGVHPLRIKVLSPAEQATERLVRRNTRHRNREDQIKHYQESVVPCWERQSRIIDEMGYDVTWVSIGM